MLIKRRKQIYDFLILGFFILLTAAAVTQLDTIQIDNSIDVFIPKDNAVRMLNSDIEDDFGNMDVFILGVKVKYGSILEPETLSAIAAITAELEENRLIDRVISLSNTDYITSSEEGMVVVPLLDNSDDLHGSLPEIQMRLAEWSDLYGGSIISSSEKFSAIIIQPVEDETGASAEEVYRSINNIIDKYADNNLTFPTAGLPVLKQEMRSSIQSDLIYLIPIAAFLVFIILFFTFRKIEGVLYPLASLGIACIVTVAFMGIAGITFTLASILVPVLLLVVGSAYGIHLLAHFYDGMSLESGFIPSEKVAAILKKEFRKVWKPILSAGLTTAAGYIALVSSPLTPFRTFALMSGFGVGIALLATFLLIPSLIRIRYRNGVEGAEFRKTSRGNTFSETPRFFIGMKKIVRKRKTAALFGTIGLIVLTVVLLSDINVGTNMAEFFTPDSKTAKDIRIFNEELNGTGNIDIVFTSPEKGGVLLPSFLSDIEKFEAYITDEHEAAASVRSLVPYIKRMNGIMNFSSIPYQEYTEDTEDFDFFSSEGFFDDVLPLETDSLSEEGALFLDDDKLKFTGGGLDYENLAQILRTALFASGSRPDIEAVISNVLRKQNYQGADFYEIPLDPAKYGLLNEDDLQNLISQYLVLYSGNLDMFINDSLEPDKLLVSVQVNNEKSKIVGPLLDDIYSYWNYHLPADWEYAVGGNTTQIHELAGLITKSQFLSLFGALAVVWLIVTIMFRSPIAGLLGMVPVVFAILGIFLSMALFGFNLDIVTSLLAALAVGIGVDYAIHLISAYRHRAMDGTAEVLESIYRTTGRAIFFNALSVALGFLGLLASRFIPIRQMGILFAVAMTFAGGSSLIILPMIIEKIKPKFLNKPYPPDSTEAKINNLEASA
jgi:uncharacterized protein